MTEEFIKEFIDQCNYRMQESIQKITHCLDELEASEVWKRPNKNSNSVGNLILHLCGNMRQYAISSLGNSKDERERNKEFSAEDGFSKAELLQKLKATADEVRITIENISPPELFRKRMVQGFSQSGIAIIIHVTEHLSYHTGQIIFWTKLLKDKDLGFYSGVNLEAKNEI